MKRQRISSGTSWEDRIGYARAVRVGPHVHVAGTTAIDENGEMVGANDPYRQTRKALRNVHAALQEAGAALADVVRTRLYVIEIEHAEEIGQAHSEFFGDVQPVTSMVEVSRLIAPDMLVEIEATAILSENAIHDV